MNILTIKNIFLILIICFSRASTLSLKRSKTPSEEVIQKLNPINSFTQMTQFVLGALSVWNVTFKSVLESSSSQNEEYFKDQFSSCLASQKEILSAAKNAQSESVHSISFRWDKMNDAERREKCETIQNNFKAFLVSGLSEDKKSLYFMVGSQRRNINSFGEINEISKEDLQSSNIGQRDYCEIQDQGVKSFLGEKWGSLRDFERECRFFKTMQCNDAGFRQSASYESVIQTILRSRLFLTFLKNVVTCFREKENINTLLNLTNRLPNFEVKESNGQELFNIFNRTFDRATWQEIKGTNINLLYGNLIKKILTDVSKQTPYYYGQMIGMGIKIAYTLDIGKSKK
jgi:hypothetical protein